MVSSFPPPPPPREHTQQLADLVPRSKDRKIRTAALESLRTFLSAKHISTALSTLDVLKLWKGLFYALWMCDRPLPQQQLCADLAALIWILPSSGADEDEKAQVVVSWLRGFWATMAREWTTGIDVLRMEKFLLLVRRVLGASLVWMQVRQDEIEEETSQQSQNQSPTKRATRGRKRAANGEAKTSKTTTTSARAAVRWNKTRVDAVLGLLTDWPFRPEEGSKPSAEAEDSELMPRMVPVGLKLHTLDIWVDEAEKAGLLSLPEDGEHSTTTEDDANPTSRVVLERLNGLVKTLNAETQAPAVRIRSKESLADERLPWNQKTDKDNDGEWGGLED